MRRTSLKSFFLILAVSFLSHPAFASDPALPKVENSLPPEKLARYHDSFDKFRDEFWEKSGYILGKEKRGGNFKVADARIEDGKLRLETKTGCFSSIQVGGKYLFRGDFDVQIDCAPEFKGDLKDMEHLAMFVVLDRTKELNEQEMEGVIIGINKPVKRNPRYPFEDISLFTGRFEKGRYSVGSFNLMDRFKGSLRITRAGNSVTTFYKKEGESDWRKMRTFSRPANPVVISLYVSNYDEDRTSIGASAPFVVFFDNFKINAAQEIMESDI
jgi:hypothetical protein